MENIAVYMRITSVSVSDDDVSSRRTSAASLATAWGERVGHLEARHEGDRHC